MYEIGKVYIWQNQVGHMACLNGEECTVLSAPEIVYVLETGRHVPGQLTDSKIIVHGIMCVTYAEKGDLRRKDTPEGEKHILSLFSNPVLETA